jgi:hypothetical protein
MTGVRLQISMHSGMARLVPHPRVAFLATAVALVTPAAADAYIGPGAGFAVMSSFLVIFVTMIVVLASVLAWPFRALWRLAPKAAGRPSTASSSSLRRAGSGLTDQFLKEGLLPSFAALKARGTYRRLQTTYPALSPVAWSSFSTGTHPARHNIFDFLDRDAHYCRCSRPRASAQSKFFRLGKCLIPRHRTPRTCGARSPSGRSRRAAHLEHDPARAITFPPDRSTAPS